MSFYPMFREEARDGDGSTPVLRPGCSSSRGCGLSALCERGRDEEPYASDFQHHLAGLDRACGLANRVRMPVGCDRIDGYVLEAGVPLAEWGSGCNAPFGLLCVLEKIHRLIACDRSQKILDRCCTGKALVYSPLTLCVA